MLGGRRAEKTVRLIEVLRPEVRSDFPGGRRRRIRRRSDASGTDVVLGRPPDRRNVLRRLSDERLLLCFLKKLPAQVAELVVAEAQQAGGVGLVAGGFFESLAEQLPAEGVEPVVERALANL